MTETSAPSDPVKPIGYTDAWKAEYDQINDNFRMLAEIRFKLLAFVPTLGGVAVFLLSKMTVEGISPVVGGLAAANSDATVGFVSALGFLATLGITFYDQRNSELYGLLVRRGRQLEEKLTPPMRNFAGRCDASRYLFGFLRMKHDTGLGLIYAPILGAWFFPLVNVILRWYGCSARASLRASLAFTAAIGLAFFGEFLRQDKKKS